MGLGVRGVVEGKLFGLGVEKRRSGSMDKLPCRC